MNIAGVDEVGRGCLAGPVVAAAVVLPHDFYDERIKDSKKLSAKKRCEILPFIEKNALSIGIGVVCNIIIDEINILNATKEAMHRAIATLNANYDKLIVDAVKLNNISTPYEHPNGADNDFIQVSAASIVAKVYRDGLMAYLATIYNLYGWEKNAGYGTKTHMEAIRKYGATPLHRKTFIRSCYSPKPLIGSYI